MLMFVIFRPQTVTFLHFIEDELWNSFLLNEIDKNVTKENI